MKAAFITDFLGISGIHIAELPDPIPTEDEVLIEVHYTGVNPVDWKITEGGLKERMPYEFPVILGWDIAGKVVKVGSNITEFAIGDEVFAYGWRKKFKYGGYADYIVLPEPNIAKKPKNLSMQEAAAIPLTSLTAWQSIFDAADLQKKENILIHAGSGGVGGMAIQLAKWKGAKVFTTTSAASADYCKTLGADVVIDYRKEDFTKIGKMDVVLDTLGGTVLRDSYSLLDKGSRIVSIIENPDQKLANLYGANAFYVIVGPDKEELVHISSLYEKKILKVPKIEEFSFFDIKKALQKSKSGTVKGKIVLKIK